VQQRWAIRMYRKLATVIQQRHRRSPGHLGLYTFKVFGVSYLFTCQSQGAVQRVVDELERKPDWG
jgi:hypothetical protein